MVRVWMGIDPGVNGGVAWISNDDRPVVVRKTPTFRPDPKSARQAYLIRELFDLARGAYGLYNDQKNFFCVLERTHAMPTNGSIGNFVLGRGSGLWEMALTAHGISYETIPPPTWKKHFGLLGQGKYGSILKAQTLFPEITFKKTDDGLAEALLLAYYGKTVLAPSS